MRPARRWSAMGLGLLTPQPPGESFAQGARARARSCLQAELYLRGHDVEAVDQVGRQEEVEPIRVRLVALAHEVALELVEALDESELLHLAEPRDRLGLAVLGRDHRLARPEPRPVVCELVPRVACLHARTEAVAEVQQR